MNVKMHVTFFILLLLLLTASCKSGAKPQPASPPTGNLPDKMVQTRNVDDDAFPPQQALVSKPVPPPENATPPAAFAEPTLDFAETNSAAASPVEAPVRVTLREPENPFPPLAQPPLPAEAPPARQPENPPVTAPPPARLDPPKPPEYLGPAEEERPPVLVKEPVPLPASPESGTPEPPVIPLQHREEAVVFSRTVRATVGQLVEVPFRGSGWVYLGEMGSNRGIVFSSRRLDPEGQSFIFRVESAGTYALKFFKQDFIHDFILNDYVQVLAADVSESVGSGWFNADVDRGRVIAEPRWPSSLAEAERRGSGQVSAVTGVNAGSAPAAESTGATAGAIAAQTDSPGATAAAAEQLPVTQADLPPPEYLQKAKEEFDAGRVASALALLDQFSAHYPSGSDEAYWLYGQFYEANSQNRDILTALDYYRRLVREFPQSSRYNDAYRRIAYLERYYINIQ